MKLGDVLSVRGGTTVEVLNTDAEGRLVMCDALVLATEEPTDAIVDIATLTGACLMALGPDTAGVIGNDQAIDRPDPGRVRYDRGTGVAVAVGSPVPRRGWTRRSRTSSNVGGTNAGAITAALFLDEFVGETPWAHIDIAGTAQNNVATSWRPVGCTGFGARLLLEMAQNFASAKLGAHAATVANYGLTGASRS